MVQLTPGPRTKVEIDAMKTMEGSQVDEDYRGQKVTLAEGESVIK